jgi:hypothetical protein
VICVFWDGNYITHLKIEAIFTNNHDTFAFDGDEDFLVDLGMVFTLGMGPDDAPTRAERRWIVIPRQQALAV